MDKSKLLFDVNKILIKSACIFLAILRLPFYLRESKTRKRNLLLKSYKMSTKCNVCGLGPSLSCVDIPSLKGDLIVVNHFYKFAQQHKLNVMPLFYCITDGNFYENINGMNELKAAIDMFPRTIFILNAKYKNNIENMFGYKENFFYLFMWQGNPSSMKKIDITTLVPIGINVVCTAITLALYLEYKEINLYGCDFNSFTSPKLLHCYKDDTNRPLTLAMELFCYSLIADQHYALRDYAILAGIKIINFTKGSLIDAYERDISE